jgi:hypothetical protein
MLDFNESKRSIVKEDILEKFSEYDIFKNYCINFEEIDKPFCSSLRVDDNPGCRIYINNNNQLRYKDWGAEQHFSCWDYVMYKYSCTYHEAINIIACDFGLKCDESQIKSNIIISQNIDIDKLKPIREKSFINIVEQPFNIVDYNYWNQFGISLEILSEYNISSAKFVYLYTRNGKKYVFEYTKNNPCYAYKFIHNGEISYKIYWPLSKDKKRKWLFSGGVAQNIEGYDQLPYFNNILILTKSMKDVMCFKMLGYPAISLQGEGNKVEQELVTKLLKRFDKIIVNYDEDEEGIRASIRIKNQYNFDYFFMDECKDLSDFIKDFGIDKAKIVIDKKICQIMKN